MKRNESVTFHFGGKFDSICGLASMDVEPPCL